MMNNGIILQEIISWQDRNPINKAAATKSASLRKYPILQITVFKPFLSILGIFQVNCDSVLCRAVNVIDAVIR